MAAPINLDGFMTNINDGISAVAGDRTEVEKNTLITRLSRAIIDLLALAPADANVPGAKDAYIEGLSSALLALWGDEAKLRPLAVNNNGFAGGGRSSRQTRRRRNGGKRNQRR